MLQIDRTGAVISDRIARNLFANLEHGDMLAVRGIIVHQTGGSTAASALASYRAVHADGAHFLIDKDGSIMQTASIRKQTYHVGKLKARCVLESRCTPGEQAQLRTWDPAGLNRREALKQVPDRFPSNADAIGIELVGETVAQGGRQVYVAVTSEQNTSLAWLVGELEQTLNIATTEVFRHPEVSYKTDSEASTARWR